MSIYISHSKSQDSLSEQTNMLGEKITALSSQLNLALEDIKKISAQTTPLLNQTELVAKQIRDLIGEHTLTGNIKSILSTVNQTLNVTTENNKLIENINPMLDITKAAILRDTTATLGMVYFSFIWLIIVLGLSCCSVGDVGAIKKKIGA